MLGRLVFISFLIVSAVNASLLEEECINGYPLSSPEGQIYQAIEILNGCLAELDVAEERQSRQATAIVHPMEIHNASESIIQHDLTLKYGVKNLLDSLDIPKVCRLLEHASYPAYEPYGEKIEPTIMAVADALSKTLQSAKYIYKACFPCARRYIRMIMADLQVVLGRLPLYPEVP